MIFRFILISFILLNFKPAFAQNLNHWETVVFDTDIWNYLIPSSEPDTNWRKLGFDDTSWNTGQGGFGYGDADDNTVISPTKSLYLRRTFNIADTSKLSGAVFNMDYDDAFVAYLNNVEIARANIGTIGDHPSFSQVANTYIEAQMYQGGNPSEFVLDFSTFKNIILPGNNVLSIQVHNESINSSDLTARPFLSLGINDNSNDYSPNPSWFNMFVFNSSNLPIVNINTQGQNIQDNVRIVADMGIIYNGENVRNNTSDPFNNYNGKISIELRGSSSQGFPKKSYSLETQDALGENNNVSILNMPEENDWVLYAPYSDKSLIRNILTYRLGESLDRYAPRTRLCELILNGEYIGVYVFMEKIKNDKNRVDIADLTENDTIGDDLTGGYILKIDKTTNGVGYNWNSTVLPPFSNNSINFKLHYPKENEELPVQANYIRNYMTDFENSLNSSNFMDTILGYRNYIDVPSFIDFFLMNEISRNVDGFRLSTYMFKDKDSKGGKLNLGPLWDFNLAFGNANYCDGSETTGWGIDFNAVCTDVNVIPFWWSKLMTDTTYTNQLKCRWDSLRVHQMHTDSILFSIDSLAVKLDESQERNFIKWDILGTYVWPNDYVAPSYEDELNYLKNWISDRMEWLDDNMPGTCYYVAPPPVDTVEVPIDTITPIDTAIAILDLQNKIDVKIYPNPAKNYVEVVFTESTFNKRSIDVFDNNGILLKTIYTEEKKNFIDLTQYSKGIYFLNIVEGQNCIKRKIVKF